MSMVDEKIEILTNKMLDQRHLVLDSQQEMREAKENLTRKRKVYEEENEKLGQIIDEIDELKNGQPHLPFSEHPDVVENGTPALLKVAENLAQDKLKSNKSLSSNLSILIGYGLSQNLVDSVMNSDLNISTVRQLCSVMESDPQWHKKVQGLGAKKVQKLKEALQKFLDSSNAKPVESEAPDNRLKQCGNVSCGKYRDPSLERCPACNDTTFVLANPPSDTEGDSTLPADYVIDHIVPTEEGKAKVTIHVVQNPDSGLWHSSYTIGIGDDPVIGRMIPHHSSAPYPSEGEAIDAACVEAGNKLMEMELDSEAASVREFSQDQDVPDSDDVHHLDAMDDELHDEESDSESEELEQDFDSPVEV